MGPRADENLCGHGAVAAEAGGPHDDAALAATAAPAETPFLLVVLAAPKCDS